MLPVVPTNPEPAWLDGQAAHPRKCNERRIFSWDLLDWMGRGAVQSQEGQSWALSLGSLYLLTCGGRGPVLGKQRARVLSEPPLRSVLGVVTIIQKSEGDRAYTRQRVRGVCMSSVCLGVRLPECIRMGTEHTCMSRVNCHELEVFARGALNT